MNQKLFSTLISAGLATSAMAGIETSYFIPEGLTGKITEESQPLADGTEVLCYVIKSKNAPQEHSMGPWAPEKVTDGKEKGGIWLKDNKVYDVDGAFVANLANFYGDPEWKIAQDDGTIRRTDSKEAFEGAAKPQVEEAYNNYAVAGNPDWYANRTVTFHIPVEPVYNDEPGELGHGTVAVAFNGVGFDPPAPIHMIIKAHTIAPFDHGGGHLNPFAGYHYHVANGKTKEIAQKDGHAPMIGYVMDGFPLFAHLDKEGKAPTGLDECGGHTDEVRGYHYHAGAPGSNQIIKAFRGTPGTTTSSGMSETKHPEGGPPGGRRGGPPGGPRRDRKAGGGAEGHDHPHGDGADHDHLDPSTDPAPQK